MIFNDETPEWAKVIEEGLCEVIPGMTPAMIRRPAKPGRGNAPRATLARNIGMVLARDLGDIGRDEIADWLRTKPSTVGANTTSTRRQMRNKAAAIESGGNYITFDQLYNQAIVAIGRPYLEAAA